MLKKRSKGKALRFFRGREAKLNHIILIILTKDSPQIIYDIAKTVRTQKGLTNTKYTNVNRRVKALENQGLLKRVGYRNTLQGVQATLFSPTTRAYVALLLNQLDPDVFIKEADEDTLMEELATLALFF